MKFRLIAMLSVLLFCQGLAHAETEEERTERRKNYRPAEYVEVSPDLPAHPRLLLLKGEEKALKKAVQKDAVWKEISQEIVDEASEIVELPVSECIQIGKRLLHVSRENLRRIFFLSYAYRMTGDKAYLERAEAEMLKAASFEDWNPSHFLDVGEMTMALAIGYDWLYQDLSAQSKETIASAIIEKGLRPSLFDGTNNNWFMDAVTNWNQVCNSGLSFGALAIWEKDPELSQFVLNRAIDTIRLPMEHYSPDGVYPEGPSYWEYGTTFNVLFLSAVEKALGTDFYLSKISGFLKTGEYMQHIVTPALRWYGYSDNPSVATFLPAQFWFYDKTKDASILYSQARIIREQGAGIVRKDRMAPVTVIWGANASLENAEKPSSIFWKGGGDNPVCFMRSSWDSPTDLYLGVKLGCPSVNHGHMDVGSFIFEADGVDWAIDLGGDIYNRLESRGVQLWERNQESQRWDAFRYNNFAHNTLAFNLKRQIVDNKAAIESFSDDPDSMSVTSDLTDVYKGQVRSIKRSFSMIDRRYAVIDDVVEATELYTMMKWTMLTRASVSSVSDRILLLEQDGKKLYLKMEGPEEIRWRVAPASPVFSYDSPADDVTVIAFDTDVEPSGTQNVKVFLIPEELL